jgi:hypothetical protein
MNGANLARVGGGLAAIVGGLLIAVAAFVFGGGGSVGLRLFFVAAAR